MKQGSILSPNADSIRVAFATWWIYITIVTSFYTANLTAFLTLAVFSLPINVPRDLLNQRQAFISQRGFAVEYAITNVSNVPLNVYLLLSALSYDRSRVGNLCGRKCHEYLTAKSFSVITRKSVRESSPKSFSKVFLSTTSSCQILSSTFQC